MPDNNNEPAESCSATVDRVAADLGYQPDSIRVVIRYLATRHPADPIDESAISLAQVDTIRDTIAGIEIAFRQGCPDLH